MPAPRSTLSFRIVAIFLFGLITSPILSFCELGDHASPGERHETPYALIFVTVWGPDSRPVYGVRVKVRREFQKKPKWEGYSDHQGEFAQRVPAGQGEYIVWADLKGYKLPDGRHLQPGTEVRVHIENDERADVGLHLK